MPKGRWLWKIGLVAGSILTLAVAIEITLRLLPPSVLSPYPPPPRDKRIGYRPDRFVLRRHIPNFHGLNTNREGEFRVAYTTNSLGFRDKPRKISKSPDVKRIIVMSDSLGEGLQVPLEQTFCQRLEAKLNSLGQPWRYEVWNTGVSGLCTLVHYIFLKRFGLKFCPDMVIMTMIPVYIERDQLYRKWCKFSAGGEPLACTHPLLQAPAHAHGGQNGFGGWLVRHSRAVKFVWLRLKKLADYIQKRGTGEFYKGQDPESAAAYRFTNSIILRIHRLCQAQSIPLLVVFIPVAPQVTGEKITFPYPTDYTHHRPQEIIGQFCREHQIPFLDLLKPFCASKVHPLFFPVDRHFTAAGHRLAARAIMDYLLAHPGLFLERPPRVCRPRPQASSRVAGSKGAK